MQKLSWLRDVLLSGCVLLRQKNCEIIFAPKWKIGPICTKIVQLDFWLAELWANDLFYVLSAVKTAETKQQNDDHRSRANVLRTCQQMVGLYIKKIRAGYHRRP